MSKEKFNNALDHIDYELVTEHLKEKELLKRRAKWRRAVTRAVPVAACFVLFLMVLPVFIAMFAPAGSAGPGVTTDNSGINPAPPASNPSEGLDTTREYKYIFEIYDNLYYVPTVSTDEEMSKNDVGQKLGEVIASNHQGEEFVCHVYDFMHFVSTYHAANYTELIVEIDGEYYLAYILTE